MRNPWENRLIYISPAYEKIWQKPIEKLKANPDSFLESIHPDDISKVKKFLQRQRTEECAERYRILWPDGSIRWVQDRAFPIRKTTGEIEMVVGAASDITKEMETARLLEIQRIQVVNSAKMSALGIMAAGVAHEINNPLAIITGRAQQIISAVEAGGDKREEIIK